MEAVNKRIKNARLLFLSLSWIYMVCLVVQTLMAGAAVFNSYEYWNLHTGFVIWFQFIPVAMLILGFIGQLPRKIHWEVISLFLLVVPLQYITVHVSILGLIHPVIALILFGLILRIIKQTTVQLKEEHSKYSRNNIK